jgi:hypothetical protein
MSYYPPQPPPKVNCICFGCGERFEFLRGARHVDTRQFGAQIICDKCAEHLTELEVAWALMKDW